MENKISNVDFDVESLFGKAPQAKPLSKGLGFHHSLKDKKEVRLNLNQKSEMLRKDLLLAQVKSEKISMGDLSPFYENKYFEKTVEEVSPADLINLKSNFVSATWDLRISAYLMDLVYTMILFSMIVCMGLLLSGLSLEAITMHWRGMAISLSPLYVLIYLFYFSFLDKTKNSTLGKRTMGIRIVSLNDSTNVSIVSTFVRSLITLFSVATFGLTTLLNFHGRISETKIVCE